MSRYRFAWPFPVDSPRSAAAPATRKAQKLIGISLEGSVG
jgi:hypothetical protein